MKKTTYTEQQIQQVAQDIIGRAKSRTLAFYASMGAGKTTLIKAMLSELGAADAGSSPTFGIVNEYHDQEGELLAYHFDFYRLNHETEVLDLGLEDYLSSDGWIFMEWPEKIGGFLPEHVTKINIEIKDARTRTLQMNDI